MTQAFEDFDNTNIPAQGRIIYTGQGACTYSLEFLAVNADVNLSSGLIELLMTRMRNDCIGGAVVQEYCVEGSISGGTWRALF